MQTNWVKIASGELSAEIDPHGAQLSSLRDAQGHDLLWNGDPAVWAGRAPLLFPIVGVVAGGRYRLGSKSYPLSRHGFARGKDFSIAEVTAGAAIFKLSADSSTLEIYPFHFELSVQFEVMGSSLKVTTTIRNRGAQEMPASFGYHPAFRWPLPFGSARSAHAIEFANDEPEPVRRLDVTGLLTSIKQPTPVENRRLELTDELFQNDVLILDKVKSRSVIYGGDRGPRLRIDFGDTPYLGLWTKPGAQFICIEPWHGITDPVGYSGDFKDKPGIFLLSSGQELKAGMTITLEGA